MRVSSEVLAVLDRAQISGNAVCLGPVASLERKLYAQADRVLQAAGGKWNRKAGAHLFEGDALALVEPILLTGVVTSQKQEFQQFDTPADLAARVIEAAGIEPGMFVLEPSAGRGALAVPAAAAGGDVACFEIDPRRAHDLSEIGPGRFDVTCYDFLKVPRSPVNDRVVMNPPFTRDQDALHVRHAAGFLRPGGRLVAIMSAGILDRVRGEAPRFRDWMAEVGATAERLPEGSFRASGTMVNAILVTLTV